MNSDEVTRDEENIGNGNRVESLDDCRANRWVTLRWAAILVAITLLAYVPAIQGGFIWDDDDYVTENPTLNSFEGLRDIWLNPSATVQYYPLVHSSFWIENHLWGLQPMGYHIVNVLLHSINALLLWRMLRLLAVPCPWLIAMIFAVHPVHVESVAWITERKNVLSGMFYLSSALCLWKCWDDESVSATETKRRYLWYGAALLLFIVALLSKTVAATFPAAFLVIVWWKSGRLTIGDFIKMAPFFFLGITLGLLTVWLEKHQVGAQGIDWELSFLDRILIAGRALWFYAGKLVWPVPLIFTYHRWDIDTAQIWQFVFPVTAIAFAIGLAIKIPRIGRGPLAAVLFFAGTLFPALGFFDVYPMRFSFVADHFQYLASIGVIVLVVVTAKMLLDRMLDDGALVGKMIAGVVIVMLAAITWQQGKIYEGLEVLWRDTIAKNPTSFMAHNNLGALLNKRGDFEEAEDHLLESIELKPGFYESVINLAKAYEGQAKLDDALMLYRQATELNSDELEGWNGMGAIVGMKGELDLAEEYFSKALELDPSRAETHANLATLHAARGDLEKAESGFTEAIALDPTSAEVRRNLAGVLMAQGKTAEASAELKIVLEMEPNNVSALLNLGLIAAGENKFRTAAGYFERITEIDRSNVKAHYNAGAMYDQLGDQAKAKYHFDRFEQLK